MRSAALPLFLAVMVLVLSGCAASSPVSLDLPEGLVAPSGQIVLPPCPASAGCEDGFVVGDSFYGISCFGVEPAAVDDETLARGTRTYEEARAIEGVPPELWLAVRGDLPCLPSEGQPLLYEWYLAHGETAPADIEEWGERVRDVTLPLTADSTPGAP